VDEAVQCRSGADPCDYRYHTVPSLRPSSSTKLNLESFWPFGNACLVHASTTRINSSYRSSPPTWTMTCSNGLPGSLNTVWSLSFSPRRFLSTASMVSPTASDTSEPSDFAKAVMVSQQQLAPTKLKCGLAGIDSDQPAVEPHTPVDRRNAETYSASPGGIATPAAGPGAQNAVQFRMCSDSPLVIVNEPAGRELNKWDRIRPRDLAWLSACPLEILRTEE